MPQVHKTTQSGEYAQKFIEFVLMQSQNAAFFLGQMPNPQTGKAEVNLEMAKLFIDQLEMIQEKTRGNLSNEESEVLNNALTNLRMAYVNAKQGESGNTSISETSPSSAAEQPPSAESVATPAPEKAANPAPDQATESATEPESKKKFTKSYGP